MAPKSILQPPDRVFPSGGGWGDPPMNPKKPKIPPPTDTNTPPLKSRCEAPKCFRSSGKFV